MYDLPELTEATDAWWAGLASHMRREGVADVPDTRSKPDDLHTHWCSPSLLMSQTCGYPLTHQLRGRVRMVGLPVYACDGCRADGHYSSLIVVPAASTLHSIADAHRGRAAFNTDDSMSGLLALRIAAARADCGGGAFFDTLVVTGGHRRSMQAVAAGKADIATIDAVTFALLRKVDPQLTSEVRVLGRTNSVPGLPYISSTHTDASGLERLQAALSHAMRDSELADARAELLLAGVQFPGLASYDVILDLEAELGSFELSSRSE